MKIPLTILIVFGFQLAAVATPQHPDTLIYKGASYSVYGFEFDEKLKRELIIRKISDKRFVTNSALWRGYRATLQIREGKLYLIGINFDCEQEPRPTPLEILGFTIPDSGVVMDHFSRALYYGHGDHWGYMHNSYSGDQKKKIRQVKFSKGQFTEIKEVETKRPIGLIEEQILSDINMLTHLLHGTTDDPDNPFKEQQGDAKPSPAVQAKPGGDEKPKPESE